MNEYIMHRPIVVDGLTLLPTLLPDWHNFDEPTHFWRHSSQFHELVLPTGHEILQKLLLDYVPGKDIPGYIYEATASCPIQNHWGINEILLLKHMYGSLSASIKDWMFGKIFCAAQSLMRNEKDELIMICFDCTIQGLHVSKKLVECPLSSFLDSKWYFPLKNPQ